MSQLANTMSDMSGPPFPGNFAAAETGVFWDLEDCKIGNGQSGCDALKNIRKAISSSGHTGTVSVRAYGDMTGLEFPPDEIEVNHFPQGQRYERHTKMLEDIVSWSSEHPEPVNLMLIIKDATEDLLDVIEILKSKKYYRIHNVS